jgi:dipeptide/tripeptide permease
MERGIGLAVGFPIVSMGVMLAAIITILIDRYVKDKFLAMSIKFAIASIGLAVTLMLYILDKRSAQRKAQSIYFVEH